MIAPTACFMVKEWRPYSKNTLRAFVSFEIPPGMILHGCTLHERDGSRWVGMPARQYQKDGISTWAPIVELTNKEARDRFQAAALAAIDRYLAEEEL